MGEEAQRPTLEPFSLLSWATYPHSTRKTATGRNFGESDSILLLLRFGKFLCSNSVCLSVTEGHTFFVFAKFAFFRRSEQKKRVVRNAHPTTRQFQLFNSSPTITGTKVRIIPDTRKNDAGILYFLAHSHYERTFALIPYKLSDGEGKPLKLA